MQKEQLISTDECCTYYNVDISFISSLSEYGLIEIIAAEEKEFINMSQLQQLEKLIRLHYELEINIEGIEAIFHLLERVENLQQEMIHLKSKLQLYESA